MKILSFGASTSSTSINRTFAAFAASQVPHARVTDLDLRELECPLFSVDAEKGDGIPPSAKRFLEMVQSHDALIVSLAEHNGSYTAGFKNLYDWTSRVEYSVWSEKSMLLLSTSPGARGGASVLEAAKATFPRMGARVISSFSLPSFHDHFSEGNGITDETLRAGFTEVLNEFIQKIDN